MSKINADDRLLVSSYKKSFYYNLLKNKKIPRRCLIKTTFGKRHYKIK